MLLKQSLLIYDIHFQFNFNLNEIQNNQKKENLSTNTPVLFVGQMENRKLANIFGTASFIVQTSPVILDGTHIYAAKTSEEMERHSPEVYIVVSLNK